MCFFLNLCTLREWENTGKVKETKYYNKIKYSLMCISRYSSQSLVEL